MEDRIRLLSRANQAQHRQLAEFIKTFLTAKAEKAFEPEDDELVGVVVSPDHGGGPAGPEEGPGLSPDGLAGVAVYSEQVRVAAVIVEEEDKIVLMEDGRGCRAEVVFGGVHFTAPDFVAAVVVA